MIIDAHNHPDWYGYSVEKVLQNMDQYNIDVTWMLSWESPEDEYDPKYRRIVPDSGPDGPISYRRCAEYARHYPERFVIGYAPDPE